MYILFYLTVICIPIKSHQSNKTCSTTLQNVIVVNIPPICFLHSRTYNTCICIMFVP